MLVQNSKDLRKRLNINTQYFRKKIQSLGFKIKPGTHPIVPVMIGDAKLSKNLANNLLSQNIYVVGFSFPVVPKGEARIRVQISASHTKNQINQVIEAFKKSGKKFNII